MQKTTIFYLTLIIILILTACGTNAEDTEPQAIELTDINFQMNWIHEYSVSPIHTAVREGFFEREGLNVTMIPGGFDEEGNYIDPFAPFQNGGTPFGIMSSSQLLQARSTGMPLIAIASLLQRSPSVLLSLEETGIQRPQDLEGKTLMTSDEAALTVDTLLATQEIDVSTIEFLPRTSFGIDPLLNGETDVMTAWIVNEGVQMTESGNTPSYIVLSDYGIDSYEFVIVTTEDVVNNNPDLAQGFVSAIIDGVEFSIANPEQSIDHTLTFNDQLEKEGQIRRLNAMIPLMNAPNIALGSMNNDTWLFTYNLLSSNDVIDDLNVADAYTTQFVDNIETNRE